MRHLLGALFGRGGRPSGGGHGCPIVPLGSCFGGFKWSDDGQQRENARLAGRSYLPAQVCCASTAIVTGVPVQRDKSRTNCVYRKSSGWRERANRCHNVLPEISICRIPQRGRIRPRSEPATAQDHRGYDAPHRQASDGACVRRSEISDGSAKNRVADRRKNRAVARGATHPVCRIIDIHHLNDSSFCLSLSAGYETSPQEFARTR